VKSEKEKSPTYVRDSGSTFSAEPQPPQPHCNYTSTTPSLKPTVAYCPHHIMTTVSAPARGSEAERQTWRRWAHSNGLTDNNDHFIKTSISERRSRFRNGLEREDTLLLNLIEKTLIDIVHALNTEVERWPETIRTILNRTGGNDQEAEPFETWYGPPGLEKRKQSTRVWTDLIQFFVLEFHINNMTWSNDSNSISIRDESGYLSEMGFMTSEEDSFGDDILDIVQDCNFFRVVDSVENLKNSIHHLCLSIVMQEDATPQNNALLFWVGLCLQTEEFGNQQRLEFYGLKDELTMKEKLEALVHYARVFIMDHAYKSWLHSDSVAEGWKMAVETVLNSKSWVDRGLPRPVNQQGDPADFSQPHWEAFKTHFEALRTKWLIKGSNSPIGIILELL
jgi:hypothetical protein